MRPLTPEQVEQGKARDAIDFIERSELVLKTELGSVLSNPSVVRRCCSTGASELPSSALTSNAPVHSYPTSSLWVS